MPYVFSHMACVFCKVRRGVVFMGAKTGLGPIRNGFIAAVVMIFGDVGEKVV